MLGGCSLFVVVSLACFALSILPYFWLTENWRLEVLWRCTAYGLLPAFLVGLTASRKAGIPGAGGFVGSSLATAIFLYVRLQQMWLASQGRQVPEIDYPSEVVWLGPVAWVGLCVVGAALVVPKREFLTNDPR